ncbi:MAG: dihydrodipicolinate synthase family protein [Clostridia bacterium]
MAKFELKDIKGVIPAMLTVFDENEEIYEKGTRALVNYLVDSGVNGLYLTGSTGEGFMMTPEERKRYVEIVVDENRGRVPLIVHVGAIGTKVSIDLAKHAEKVGADAISSVPPFYWNFKEDNIFEYYKDISESVDLPMVVYNIALAGTMNLNFIYRLATLKNVRALKFTATNHHAISYIKNKLGKDFIVYSGCDEMATSGLISGADGIIGSFYNIVPDLFLEINSLVQKGDIKKAMERQIVAAEFIDVYLKYDFLAAMTQTLTLMGQVGGYSRRPFKNLNEETWNKLLAELSEFKKKFDVKGIKLFDYIK